MGAGIELVPFFFDPILWNKINELKSIYTARSNLLPEKIIRILRRQTETENLTIYTRSRARFDPTVHKNLDRSFYSHLPAAQYTSTNTYDPLGFLLRFSRGDLQQTVTTQPTGKAS